MKKNILKSVLAILILCITFSRFTGAPAIPVFAQSSEPKSVFMNFGDNSQTGINFSWNTASKIKTGVVEYCQEDLFHGFTGANVLRVTAHSYEAKNDKDTRTIHKAELTNLKPGMEYVYRVGNGTDSFSPQSSFKTAGGDLKSFTFISLTDTQGESAKDYLKYKNILDKALEKFPETSFLIHTGDMVDNGDRISQWDLFSGAAKAELMKLPIAPSVGNHEAFNKNNTNANTKNFVNTFNPTIAKDTGAPSGTVYSFDYGNAHIAVMNTQCGSKNLKKQAEWLKKDMTKSGKLWKIVALHRGPYGATYDTTDIRRVWTPVFDEVGVDLVFQGHDHNYVRSYPMKNKVRVKDGEGTVYMIGNTGGVKFYPLKSRSWQAVNLQPKTQMYIAVTIENSIMTVGAYDVKNTLCDSLVIKK